MPQCTAKCKSTQQRCRKDAKAGSNVCRFHGGASGKGIASASYKTGKYSKHLPTRLLEHYQSAVSDSELLALREDIALIDTRLADLLSRVDAGEGGSLWQQLNSNNKELMAALNDHDESAIAETLAEQICIIHQGNSDYQAWREINKLLEQRRKQAESERKRLMDMQQYVSVESTMVLVSALINSCRTHVKDSKALQHISNDLSRLLTVPGNSGSSSE